MNPTRFLETILRPGLNELASLPKGPQVTNAALIMLLTIAQQESGLKHRAQVLSSGNPGPARGWWQFEQGGGVVGVMTHPATKTLALELCQRYDVPFEKDDIWRCLEGHDFLAAGFARLLLWSDPKAIPTSHEPAWQTYLATWRPGKPHPSKWEGYWTKSIETVTRG